jgi:hypothetical protein
MPKADVAPMPSKPALESMPPAPSKPVKVLTPSEAPNESEIETSAKKEISEEPKKAAKLSSARKPKPRSKAKPKRSKVRATFNLDPDLYEEVRDTVVALSGPATQLSLVAFFEEACRREIERLSNLHNEGERFPKRKTALPGRRIS